MKNRICASIVFILVLMHSLTLLALATPFSENDASAAISRITELQKASYGSVQEWIDNSLSEEIGVGGEWYAIALSQYDKSYDFSAPAKAAERLLEKNGASAISVQKYALVILACGEKIPQKDYPLIEDSFSNDGVMTVIFGLHLINNGVEITDTVRQDLLTRLVALRGQDGGWCLSGGSSDVDITAMAIQALAPHYAEIKEVRDSVDAALSFLSAKQTENGGFISYGVENCESCAQVAIALTALGIDPRSDERFIKNGLGVFDSIRSFELEDGSFSHTAGKASSAVATSQVFCSLVSFSRMCNSAEPLYLFDAPSQSAPQKDFSPSEKSVATAQGGKAEEGSKVQESAWSYKTVACAVIGASAVLICVLLLIRGKKSLKNFVFILFVAAALICVLLLTNIESADNYYQENVSENGTAGFVTISIRCDTAAKKETSEHIPSDGIILAEAKIGLDEGDTVYDILIKAAKKYDLQTESEGVALGSTEMAYISGINYLYEYDYGETSGWMFFVNGSATDVGCAGFLPKNGDKIEWLYTCELGDDLK